MRHGWLGLLAAGLISAPAQAQQGPSIEEIRAMLEPYASPADVVTLPDGRQVGFTCMGQGSPTVILIPGMGDLAAMSWGNVQPEMAKTTRVCTWDRPGWGLSDGAEGKHTVATSTATLEAALATGKIPGPYILVGHSLGSYESLLYADRHPDQTAGMVLVDPSFPDQVATSSRVGLPAPDPEAGLPAAIRKCAVVIREGRAKLGGPDPDNCMTYPPFFPPPLAQALGAKVSNPVQYETMASFLGSFAEDSKIVINPSRTYGDMPLIVLTATVQPPPPPDMPAEMRTAGERFMEEWSRAHDALAALSSRGINARVPGAVHDMQRSRPQVVVDAVEAVVAEAREAAR
ncbi:MAG TPA: alpha/beta hydrolase [Croceibacterium sp.]|nr:alpha/beta hydrolase [Croceibacterium sp.]